MKIASSVNSRFTLLNASNALYCFISAFLSSINGVMTEERRYEFEKNIIAFHTFPILRIFLLKATFKEAKCTCDF